MPTIPDRYMEIHERMLLRRADQARVELVSSLDYLERGIKVQRERLEAMAANDPESASQQARRYSEDLNVGMAAHHVISAQAKYAAALQDLADMEQLTSFP